MDSYERIRRQVLSADNAMSVRQAVINDKSLSKGKWHRLRSIAELMKLDKPKFETVLKAHTRAAIQGRPNQTLLAAECARVISNGGYARIRAEALASGDLV